MAFCLVRDGHTMKKYFNVIGSGTQKVKVESFYDKGSYNYYTSKQSERGYYISVTVLEVSKRNGYISEAYSLFDSGYKQLVKPVSRASKKAEQEVEDHMMEYADSIIKRLCEEKQIEIGDEWEC